MQRRGLLGVLAFILALVGGILIFLYVQGSDARALANHQPAPVLVVTRDVPAGTTAEGVAAYVETRQLPQVAIVAGAVSKLDQLPQNTVASTGLKEGEQVLASRFVPPDSNEVTAPIPIPKGLQLVSIQLDPERGAGAQLRPGDKVGVFLSLKATVEGESESVTDLIANDVLVARVQGAPARPNSPESAQAEALPTSSTIVTLAVRAPLAQRIVFGKEYGTVWLSLQTPTTDHGGIEVINSGNVLE